MMGGAGPELGITRALVDIVEPLELTVCGESGVIIMI
jgi:hypothetical protein